MRKLIYSMQTSLDGFIAGPDGDFGWAAPDEELFRFHYEQATELGGHLLGRRLYETMVYWETADRDPSISDVEREWALLWQRLPKVVFSTTLREVEGENTRLATRDLATEVEQLKAEPGEGDIAVGGAALGASCAELDLIDEYGLFVNPIVVGGGTPFLPGLDSALELELAETRTFGSRVVYLRYRRVRTTDVST